MSEIVDVVNLAERGVALVALEKPPLKEGQGSLVALVGVPVRVGFVSTAEGSTPEIMWLIVVEAAPTGLVGRLESLPKKVALARSEFIPFELKHVVRAYPEMRQT